MDFAEPLLLIPLALWLLLAPAALALAERRRRRDLAAFGDVALLGRASALPRARGRILAQALAVTAVGLALLALARPRLGEKPLVLTRTGRDVAFVLDLSRSMLAEDVRPSRLEAAKHAAREVLEASPGDRVALVIFGGSAFLQVPLTLDRAAFELFLEAAGVDDVSDPGTNLAVALATAAEAFGEDSERRYRAAVVLSDGEGLEGEVGGAIRVLREAGIRTFALGLGTEQGAPIPSRVGERLLGYHRDAAGEVVVTRLEAATLERVARETGGTYRSWDGGRGARRLALDLAQLESREISSRTFTQLAERYQWPLALALAALLLEWVVAWRARPAAAVLALLVPVLLEGQQPSEGERLYHAGDFAAAYEAFRAQAEGEDPDPALTYDTGNALYRLGRYDAAAASYRDALGGGHELRHRASYNLGNAFFKSAEDSENPREGLRRAISAYEEALVLNPDDEAAKWNLELALRRLDEEEERRSPSAGGGGGGGGGGDGGDDRPQDGGEEPDERGPGQPPPGAQPQGPEPGEGEARAASAGSLTEEQARQLLQAIEDEEGEALQGRNEGRRRLETGRNDW
ncbi:MAG: VWA domain-containing protein [Gemmatimonadota bacterium]